MYSYVFLVPLSQMHICMIYAGGLSLGATMNVLAKKNIGKNSAWFHKCTGKKHERAGVAYSVYVQVLIHALLNLFFTFKGQIHGLMNYIDTKAKCHLKKLTCTKTLRQVFIRVYRLEIPSGMLIFSTQLCELLPLSPSLWFNFSTSLLSLSE